jgi:hypothetical protein
MGSLVPLVDRVVVYQHGLDLDCAQETVVDDGTVVDIKSDERCLGGDVAGAGRIIRAVHGN